MIIVVLLALSVLALNLWSLMNTSTTTMSYSRVLSYFQSQQVVGFEMDLNTGDIKAVNFAGGIAGNNMLIIGSSYSTGDISVTNTGGNIGGIAGRNDQYNGTGAKILNCYYANAGAAYGTDSNPASSEITAWAFSATAWPTDDPSSGWGVGNDYENGYFWDTLGHWDAVSPEYPQLSLPASPSASASMAASSPVSDNAFEGLDKAIREGISASPSPASAEHR